MWDIFAKNKINLIVISIFTIVALVYSEIIVLDEEALIAACFIMFVIFAYQILGQVIASELDNRAEKIASELRKSLDYQKEHVLASINYLKKQEQLTSEINDLYEYVLHCLKNISFNKKRAIQIKINNTFNQQLRMVFSKEQELISILRNEAIYSFCDSIIEEFKQDSLKEIRNQLLEESINTLESSNIAIN